MSGEEGIQSCDYSSSISGSVGAEYSMRSSYILRWRGRLIIVFLSKLLPFKIRIKQKLFYSLQANIILSGTLIDEDQSTFCTAYILKSLKK